MSNLIDYKGVAIHQADQIVLHDVNLTVQSGEMIYLLGKVGSGKSSLMKTFYGALPIAGGQARVLEYDMTRIRRRQLPYLRRMHEKLKQEIKTAENNILFFTAKSKTANKLVDSMQKKIDELKQQLADIENKMNEED